MAVVTGVLSDFGISSLIPLKPMIVFTATGPAMHGDTVLFTKPVKVLAADNGTFSATLVQTTLLQPYTTYRAHVEWLDSGGNCVGVDHMEWELRVPAEGGTISNLLAAPQNPTTVWVGLTPPLNPTTESWWLNSSDDGLSGTGLLYEWIED